MESLLCKYCNKACLNLNSLKQHECSCQNNLADINLKVSVRYKASNYKQIDGTYVCPFCDRICKNLNGFIHHVPYCKNNLTDMDRKSNIKIGFNNKGRVAWNKGLTKETDERVKHIAEMKSGKPGTFKGHKHTDTVKSKLSQVAKLNKLGGKFYRGGSTVSGIKLDSSYEVKLAENLNSNGIKWERGARFNYRDLNNHEHTYTPDFYLPEYNIYLDPKNDYLINNINPALGYRDLDKINWVMEQNNIKIIVLDKNQLDWKNIKELL